MKPPQRRDLDALRGIAILSVILFHIDAPFFTNGHFGVDIFFVLSGYFIFTSHCLMPDRSLFEFFSKRVWRIFPAYFTFLVLTSFAAYYLLIPDDFVLFVKDIRQAAGFVSNFKSPSEKGYWVTLQQNQFLLHTWSFSVEIQFYICSAPLAFLLKQTGKHFAFFLIVLSIGLHFIVPEVVAFYSLPCRIWQFLCGYVAVNWQHNDQTIDIEEPKNCEKMTDLGLIVSEKSLKYFSRIDNKKTFCAFSVFFLCIVSNFHQFLFVQRILVTALSCYIVSSSSTNFSLIDQLWNNKFFCFFGAISYSWYLWHWPASVLISYLNVDMLHPLNLYWYLTAPLGIAVISTYFIERPLLKRDHGKSLTIAIGCLPPLICVSASFIFLQIHAGIENGNANAISVNNSTTHTLKLNNIIEKVVLLSKPTYDPNDPKAHRPTHLRYCQDVAVSNACYLGDKNSTDHTVLWGDSFSMTAFLAHSWYLPEIVNKTKVTLFTRGGCPPYHECKLQNPGCAYYNAEVLKQLPNLGAKRLILSSRYILTYRWILGDVKNNETAAKMIMQECLMSTMRLLMKMGIKEILLLHQIPEPSDDIPQSIEKGLKFGWDLAKIHINRTEHEKKTAGLHESIIKTGNLTSGCIVEDPASAICNKQFCPTWYITENNVIRPLFFDSEHLNEYGIKAYSKLFKYPWKDENIL